MDKATFKHRLDLASSALLDFSKQMCFNEFSNNYQYKILPDNITFDENTTTPEDLTEQDILVLKKSEKLRNQLLTSEQIVDLFYWDNKVPVWIDMTVYEAQKDLTVIELLCSDRLRDDKELYNNGEITPFRIKVAMPLEYRNRLNNIKFDVNWRAIRNRASDLL